MGLNFSGWMRVTDAASLVLQWLDELFATVPRLVDSGEEVDLRCRRVVRPKTKTKTKKAKVRSR